MRLFAILAIVLAVINHVYGRAISTTASIHQLSIRGVNRLFGTVNDEHAQHLTPYIEIVLLERGLSNGFPNPLQVAGDWDPNDPASPDQLEKYAKKGAFLRCLLDGTDAAAGKAWDPLGRTPGSASSQWKGTLENELQTWYWKSASVNQAEQCHYGSPSDIGVALEGLGLNIHPTTDGGHNICYTVEHFIEGQEDDDGDEVPPEDQHYTVAGKEYKV
ncbi:hypothetical protein IAQ61_001246 [Plenodomus lingam]|uniref:uncharacterized protein n=1 Tax=Leptosphaeria maculans TaxID=5022 RepID=UPI00331FCA88|nr:hypothetical protein IAQ61_001246 [Plenodomus lingam]